MVSPTSEAAHELRSKESPSMIWMPQTARQLQIPTSTKGVVVTEVDVASAAYEARAPSR